MNRKQLYNHSERQKMILDNRMKLLAIPPTENWRDAILHWAKRYKQEVSQEEPELWELEKELLALREKVHQRKHLTKDELVKLVSWKIHWQSKWKHRPVTKNSEGSVVTHTSAAFRTTDIQKSIDHLSKLKGIRLSVGSAILHLFHEDNFPIYDQHALRAVGEKKEERLWRSYVVYCRNIAKANNVSMRTLDRALYRFGQVLKVL